MSKLGLLQVLSVIIFHPMVVQGGANDNKLEYQALCHIVRVLQKISEEGAKRKSGIKETTIISTARHNISITQSLIVGDQVTKTSDEAANSQSGTRGPEWEPVRPRTPFGKYIAGKASKRVAQIASEMEPNADLVKKLTDVGSKIETAAQAAVTEASSALCGKASGVDMSTCDTSAFGSAAAQGMKTEAGKSLANDLAYMCGGSAGRTECISTPSAPQVEAAAGGSAMYKELVTKCEPKEPETSKPSHHELDRALSKFYGLLGQQIKYGTSNGNNNAIVGKSVLGKLHQGASNQDHDCDASRPCINYGARTDPGQNEIAWVNHVRSVSQKWREVEDGELNRTNLLEKLKNLQGEAWRLYEETKADENVSLDGASPIATGSVPTKNSASLPTDKMNAQEPTAVSASAIPCFILPWTMLI